MIFKCKCGTIRYNTIRHDKPGGLDYSVNKKKFNLKVEHEDEIFEIYM